VSAAGLVQLSALWCAGEPAEEGAVGAERCRSSTYQHSAPRPHHSGVATTSLAAGPATSGVQDCVSCTPIARFNGADVPVCRHSSCLRAWSPSPLIFISITGCSTDANHLRWQKLHCRRTAPVEQFAGYSKTDHQLRTV